MDLKSIQTIKDVYMQESTKPNGEKSTMSEVMIFHYTNGLTSATTRDCIIFDDENEILHGVCANEDPVGQATFPIKVFSGSYVSIDQIEGVFSQANFEKIINEGYFSSLVSDEQKKFLLAWARHIRNQAIQPREAERFYIDDPLVIPMPNNVIKREETINKVSIKAVATNEALTTALADAKDGDIIAVNSAITISEPMTIDKAVMLRSNGAKITAPLTITADAGLSGFEFDVQTLPEDGKRFIHVTTAGSFLFTDNTINIAADPYHSMYIQAPEVIISGNNFNANEETDIHNGIELDISGKYPIKKLTVSGNKFNKAFCRNNTISMYCFEEGATVDISDNVFEYSGNAMRISNMTDAVVTFNITDNTYKATTTTDAIEYAGFVLLQAFPEDNDFSKVTLNFKRLIGPGGKAMTSNGTGVDQVWYTYNTETVPNVNFR